MGTRASMLPRGASLRPKANSDAPMKQSSKDLDAMARNTKAKVDDDLLDDEGEYVAARGELKAKGQQRRADEDARMKQSSKDLDAMARDTKARTDNDLLDDEVEGVGMSQKEMRR